MTECEGQLCAPDLLVESFLRYMNIADAFEQFIEIIHSDLFLSFNRSSSGTNPMMSSSRSRSIARYDAGSASITRNNSKKPGGPGYRGSAQRPAYCRTRLPERSLKRTMVPNNPGSGMVLGCLNAGCLPASRHLPSYFSAAQYKSGKNSIRLSCSMPVT